MSASPDIFTVFYCWQSDSPPNHGRYLICEALDQASDRLSRDAELPCKLQIDSDTANETGLCDIPATILKKIASADVVVADLTFVSQTEDGKYCPNPNVLFELGFAFHAIGPERLICVMNEKHGPKNEQIFDLAHRRHPIAFISPTESSSRKETVEKLSQNLEAALRPIIELGRSGAVGGDDQRHHEAERARIEAYWDAQKREIGSMAAITFSFRPLRYRERRWPNAPSLENLALHRAIRSRGHEFPPQPKGTAAIEWGIYNDTYGFPDWALTYAGQIWLGVRLQGGKQAHLSEYDLRLSPEPPANGMVEPIEWLPVTMLAEWFRDSFKFAASVCGELSGAEQIEWSVTGRNLARKWLAIDPRGTPSELLGPSRSPSLSRPGQSTAGNFREHWFDHCLDCAKEACDLFSRDGRYATREFLASLMGGPTKVP